MIGSHFDRQRHSQRWTQWCAQAAASSICGPGAPAAAPKLCALRMSRFLALFAVLLAVVQAEDIMNWVMSALEQHLDAARGTDCEVGAWQDCSACSATCGDGVKLCVRKLIVQRSGSGRPCPPLFEQRLRSAATACAVDCAVSQWAACSECTRSCGGGTQLCRRSVVSHAAHGGRPCLTAVAAARM